MRSPRLGTVGSLPGCPNSADPLAYVFIVLIWVYARYMDRLDARHRDP